MGQAPDGLGGSLMDEIVTCNLAANAGVLFTYQGRKILVDGLFMVEGNPFSDLPAGTIRSLREGLPPYDHIDYLLFTHDHSDHFSPELVAAYVAKHPVKGVLLPPVRRPAQARLRELLQARGIPCPEANAAQDAGISWEPGIRVQSLPTRHLDRRFWDVPHFVLLLTLGDKHLLLTGDVDYTAESLPGLPPLRAVFLNPMFFHALCTGRFFRGVLPTDTLCVYHMPFPPGDPYRLRAMLEKDLARRPPLGPAIHILERPNQCLLL